MSRCNDSGTATGFGLEPVHDVLEQFKADARVIAMLLFGSRATGAAHSESNVDLYIFDEDRPADTPRVTIVESVGHVCRIERIPYGLLRNINLFHGTLKDEIFFSTVEDGQVLFDRKGRLTPFSNSLSVHAQEYSRRFALIRISIFLKFFKMFWKSRDAGQDEAATVAFIQCLVVLGELRVSLAGSFVRRSWLSQLKDIDAALFSVVKDGFRGSGDSDVMQRTVEQALARVRPVLTRVSDSLLMLVSEPADLNGLGQWFPFMSIDEIEMARTTLRRPILSRRLGFPC